MFKIFSKYSIRKYNFFLVFLTITISVIGILLIGSAKSQLMERQIQGLIIGLVFMIPISLIDYHFVLKFYWLEYALALVLLVAVYLFGDKGGGASRWFTLFGVRFQPSELVKILLILFYAQFIMKHEEKLNTFRMLISCVVLIVPPFVLIFKQPDLSTSIMILVIFCVLMFLGGLSYKVILVVAAVAIPSAVILLNMILTPGQTIVNEYQQKRLLAWIQPEKYASTEAYQQLNSITAIGSGLLQGKGLNNNVISSVKNGNFISEAQTDFIFAIAGEELGFIGCCAIIILLFLIVVQCIWIAVHANDLAGRLIAGGMAGFIGFQTFINIGVTTMILPNTGLTLPFVSYGLTSLVTMFIGTGLVLNVRLQSDNTLY
ncbi:MAG: FtsW/RodA/SpoVE family cell cycle protein [Lachnospiraceae bacterium]|nr:FtsW/RodA/SpoVE family cell cycle protein [Lachnospiraceae bacterium]